MKKELRVFSATWCSPCQAMKPTLTELQAEGHDVDIKLLDAEENKDMAIELSIRSVPTLILFNDGKEIARTLGNKSRQEILDFVRQ